MKKMKHFRLFFALLILGNYACSTLAQEPSVDVLQNIQVDVIYLASDFLQGRETGTTGEERAAQYLVTRFQEAGLSPKGDNGSWFQSFEFNYNTNPHAANGESRTGKNVVGYLDNQAAQTIVIGAHYDHLGMGTFSSRQPEANAIHNGADDNASGVAGMIRLAQYLKNAPAKNNNYLFIGFSGEEMGLHGSKHFVDNPTVDLTTVNYMLNMDMIGKLNADKVLVINGAGTSPVWKEVLPEIEVDGIKIETNDSGVGPSDHTSFYLKDLPVLHFFTGAHDDYHKPSDDSEDVNFEGIKSVTDFMIALIKELDGAEKLEFTATKDESSQRAASFKVTLGVMPDYAFGGKGMRIDKVLDDRPAAQANIQDGDVIIQLGEVEVQNIYDYMNGLSKFKAGERTIVVVKRGDKVIEKEVEF